MPPSSPGPSPALDLDFSMRAERTPNPHSVKWVVSRALVEDGRSAHFEAAPAPDVSPLAARLFAVEGVAGVFLARNFVTVTKREDVEWPALAQPMVDALKAFGASGEPALGPAWQGGPARSESGVEERIRRILDEEIRPYVAQDGGDVLFAGFRDGRVELYLQGSCSGCPSSTATLKLGIETRLREAVPEVEEVVAI
jgi:Fe-S cluster biogenesis protein NfuA